MAVMKNFAQGNHPGERIDSLNRAMNSFRRRLSRKVVGAIPPIPIFGYAREPDEDGTILRSIMPADGEIFRFCMLIGRFETVVKMHCGVYRKGGRLFQDFQVTSRKMVEDVSIDVEAGDILEIGTDPNAEIGQISVSLLYRIGIEQAHMHEVLIEALEIEDEGI